VTAHSSPPGCIEMPRIRWVRYGPDAVMVWFASSADEVAFSRGLALSEFLDTQPPSALKRFSVGFTSLLLEFDQSLEEPEIRRIVDSLHTVPPRVSDERPCVTVDVVYDGPDLDFVAACAGLSPQDTAALHASGEYIVHVMGFSPGFAYLRGLDPRLHVARLPSPRTRVPAGSLAVGGEHTAIYPSETPGGWHLIGRALQPVFDPSRFAQGSPESAFLLSPGVRVRFRPVSL